MGGSPPTPGSGPDGSQAGGGRPGRVLGELRGRAASLASAPWTRAPLLLTRFPGLLLAVGSAVLILSVSSAAAPLFLSSAGDATLHQTLADTCPWATGMELRMPAPLTGRTFTSLGQVFQESPALEAFAQTDQTVRQAFIGLPHTKAVDLAVLGSSISVKTPGTDLQIGSVRLFTRESGLAHVNKLSTAGGEGVWLPDTAARSLHVSAGDTISLTGPRRAVETRVAGTYRDLGKLPRSRYWCGQEHLLFPLSAFSNTLPPPLVMADRETFLSLGHRLGERGALITWNVPIATEGLTVPQANQTASVVQAAQTGLFQTAFGARVQFGLPFAAALASATVESLRGPVETVSLAGRVVAMVVIGAAGLYWVHRRRIEVGLLASKGASPGTLGVKALLEAIPVSAVGAALGWLAAIWLVKRLGPTGLIDASASSSALRQVIGTTVVSLVLLAVVASAAARRETEITVSRTRQAFARAPWEIPVLGLAVASLYEVLSRRPPQVTDIRVPPRVDVLVLLFPILFVAGMAGLGTRLLRRFLPGLRRRGSGWPPPLYLSTRRLAAAPQIAMALLTVSALAIGILAYAGTLTSSEAATAEAKAAVFVGSDLAVNLPVDPPVPDPLPFPATHVSRNGGGTFVGGTPGSNGVDILGIDPATFPGVAFWDRSFGAGSLQDLMAGIRDAPLGRPLPVLASGGSVAAEGTIAVSGTGGKIVPYRVVAFLRAFPGLHSDQPMVVTTRQALQDRGITGVEQLWAKGNPAVILRTLIRAGSIIQGSEAIAEETRRLPQFTSLRWTLGFLQALGVMTGLIALGGIVLYLESRQRAREISYALARRMGLSRRDHRRSVALELAAMLGTGVLLGVTMAWLAARMVYGKLDPMPILAPPPLFRSPYLLVGVTALAAVVASWIGAWLVQRTAERVDVTEVMRLAA